MHSYEGYVEIGQDAAALIESGNNDVKGVYTAGIETCMVVAFECTDALIVVHDSAQLAFGDITALIGHRGRCKRLTAIYPATESTHADRLNRLKLVTGVKDAKFRKIPVQASVFAVAISVDGECEVLPNGSATGFTPLPDRQIRTSVTELNNFFLTPNSKALKLDLQFSGGRFNPSRGTDKTIDQILETCDREPKYFFTNAALIYAAHQMDVVTAPPFLLALVERYSIKRFRSDLMSSADFTTQAIAFREYLVSRAR